MTDPASARTAADLLRSAVARHLFPAAVAEAGRSDGIIWREPFGALTFDAAAAATELATLFDLASLTKPIATTTLVLRLCLQGQLSLDDPVSRHVAEWTGADRATATIRLLLQHAAGLSPRLVDPPPSDQRSFEHEICAMPLEYPPGSRSVYTDLGFLLLGFAAERQGAGPLAAQVGAMLGPLIGGADADATLVTSVPVALRARVAPTFPLAEDLRRGRRLVGEVHDNYAAALGGFAGHAGLFGTASGVGLFARAMLRALAGHSWPGAPLPPAAARLAVEPSGVPGSSRALGWDTMRPTSSCGSRMSARAFGHVGFTGTSLWIDPERDRYFVLLTNRVCGGGTSEDMQEVRRAFHDAMADI